MLLLIHVSLALGAIALSIMAQFVPSNRKLKTSYGLATGTLTSGALLIVLHHADVLRTCLTGIMFFGAVSLLNELARRRLATQEE